MDRKRASWVLVALGVLLFLVSAFAEPLGLGDSDGIGYKQGAGMIVGGIVILAGLALALWRPGVHSAPTDV